MVLNGGMKTRNTTAAALLLIALLTGNGAKSLPAEMTLTHQATTAQSL